MMRIATKVAVIITIIIICSFSIFFLVRNQLRLRAARSIVATIERNLRSKDSATSMLVDIDIDNADYVALVPPYTGQSVRFIGGEQDAVVAAIVSKSSLQSQNKRARIVILRQGRILAESDITVPCGPDCVAWKVRDGKILINNDDLN